MEILICGQPMTRNCNFHFLGVIRLGKLLSLIFFASVALSSCDQNKSNEIAIIWRDSQAVGISVPDNLLDGLTADSLRSAFRVSLDNQNKAPILGETAFDDDKLVFTPVIPLSRGLRYEIFLGDKLLGKITVPRINAKDAPQVVSSYPTADTLPENLLKIYFLFSHPMREGVSLQHIWLLNDRNDTLQNVFLPLQPELWNKERNTLTIWLDPGRIKRDLIPNQEMGNPLVKGERYTLVVEPGWKDTRGLHLSTTYTRKFIVSSRDSLSPDIDQWTLDLPVSETREPLVVNTIEPMDYFLLQETLAIVDENRNKVEAAIKINSRESTVNIIPDKAWKPGRYRLQVSSYLEDLAGNNLNKVFDRDITSKQMKDEQPFYEKHFLIK